MAYRLKNKLNSQKVIMEVDICPYKVLNVSKNCTIDELKARYKKLAMQYHPDKGGNKVLFDLLTKSFKHIFNDIKYDQNHASLREQYANYEAKQNQSISQPFDPADGSFVEKFNKHFDKHKTNNPIVERGYSNFMNAEKVKTSSKNYKLKKYHEPDAVNISKLQYEELGVDVRDFSGKNNDSKNLNFMDYEYAHTTSKLIDHDYVKSRQEFNSLKEIETKRSVENFQMTSEEKRHYEKLKTKEANQERKRLMNLSASDQLAQDHFMKISNLQIS
jgi:curved DNA-binding protein CbpA